MANPTNNPTFNKTNNNGVFPGFYSRVLFSYAPYETVLELLQNGNGDWVINGNQDGIESLILGSPGSYFGSHILPAYYWRPGKTIRLTGDFSINIPAQTGLLVSKLFNLRFGIIETGGSSTQALAVQNKGINNHNMSILDPNVATNYIPIHFECTITCAEVETSVEPYGMSFFTNGFYYYEWYNFNSNGPNRDKEVVYVPVWLNSDGRVDVGNDYYVNTTKIMMNCYDSAIYGYNGEEAVSGQIYLTKLLIEELA